MEEFNFDPEQAGLEPGRTVSTEDWYKLESAARRLKAREPEEAVMAELIGSDDLHDLTIANIQHFLNHRRDTWQAHERPKKPGVSSRVSLGLVLLSIGFLCMLGATVIGILIGEVGPRQVLLTVVIFGALVQAIRRRDH